MWDLAFAGVGFAAGLLGAVAGLAAGVATQHWTGQYKRFRQDYAEGFYAFVIFFVALPASVAGIFYVPYRVSWGDAWYAACVWQAVLSAGGVFAVTNVGPFFGFYR